MNNRLVPIAVAGVLALAAGAPGAQAASGTKKDDHDVVDAEFTEVKDKK